MKTYCKSNPCPKCGSSRVGTLYRPLTDILKRTCEECWHQWSEAPLDSDPGLTINGIRAKDWERATGDGPSPLLRKGGAEE